jgi:hypothetical protein
LARGEKRIEGREVRNYSRAGGEMREARETKRAKAKG